MEPKILPFHGVSTALVTPFTDDGAVDYTALRRLIHLQIDSGINALVILGTTGESSTLTHDERLAVIDCAVQTVRERVPVIVGTGSNNTAYSIFLSREACRLGADALLAVTPYYNKASPEGLIAHFTSIAEASSVPIILYNVPGRTGLHIPMHVYRKLSEIPNIVAVKEASGDLSSVSALCAEFGKHLAVYSGNDELTLPTLAVGGEGVISVVSNILPHEMCDLYDHFTTGDLCEARAIQHRLNPLISALFSEVNPIPIKCACSMLGLCNETLRLPLCPLNEEKRKTLAEEMNRLNLLKRG